MWSTSNRAATTMWITLYSMNQLTTNFADSATLTMDQLTFFNPTASPEQQNHTATMIADQLDNVFINGRGAKYEPGVTRSDAIAGIIAILIDKTQTVETLASTADGYYLFWNENSHV